MFGNQQKNFGCGTMEDASGNTSMTPSEKENALTYKLVRVDGDGSYLPTTEDELEVQHLLAEPRNDKVLVDNILCYNSGSSEKCLTIEDFPCAVDYDHMKTSSGMLHANSSEGEREESKFEFLDGMFHGIGEGDLHVPNGLSTSCDDYLLDTEYAERVPDLDYGSCEGSHVGNLRLESQPSCLSGKNSITQMPDLTETIPVLESTSDQSEFLLDKMTIYDLQEAFRTTFGRETSVKDKQWLKRRISFGLQNLVEFGDVSDLLESGIPNGNEGDMIFTSSNDSSGRMQSLFTNVLGNVAKPVSQDVERESMVAGEDLITGSSDAGKTFGVLDLGDGEGVLVAPKRLRKPTRRYIEESSDLKSRYSSGRVETPTSSRDKILRVKSHSQHNRKGLGTVPLVSRQDYLGGTGIQVPFGLRVRKGRPKKNTFLGRDSENEMEDRNSYMEHSPPESQDDMSDDYATTRSGKAGVRRKHHRLWTLSEVIKLIDGVSQYGVGRWTEIKRLLFSSSAYRTSVDLKDKWRNLLRASCAQMQSKREVEQGRKHAYRPIPPSVLRRVSELAIIYPYPRERKSKSSRTSIISPSIAAAAATPSSDTPANSSERIILRKR
ncbi:PREDICTED: uncharacterized protein LOC104601289 [Nelumbo nucifera]|uniref:Uncharacterized protein LOC104601289 n=1 Tax=Nelumbo nucifera TaxID=4432 RepID=A0A1U8AKQ7_NELNU|nr:PREDICTED: uncharacterized protein LOC104601289 [Nelumbo nucifera]